MSSFFYSPPQATDRCPSEWFLEKFLEETAEGAAVLGTPPPPVAPNSNTSPNTNANAKRNSDPRHVIGSMNDVGNRGNEEVVEIEDPVAAVSNCRLPAATPSAGVGPGEYAVLLKKKLDMYCAAVAKSRSSSIKPQESSFLADPSSQASDASQLGSQSAANVCGPSGGQAPHLMQTLGLGISDKCTNSCSSKELSDDKEDDLEGETETLENLDPAGAKRMRRVILASIRLSTLGPIFLSERFEGFIILASGQYWHCC